MVKPFMFLFCRAVELITTEHHQAARSLYANWGFEFQQVYRKNYLVWGIVSLAMFRYGHKLI